MDRIECFSVVINYSDFLQAVAPHNAPLFDRWVIATHPSDEATREVCRKFSLECILIEEGQRDGQFSKGHIVERVLQHASADGWRLHLDADCVLPSRFRQLLQIADIEAGNLYGFDRVMIKGWDEWQKLKKSGFLENGGIDYQNQLRFPKGYDIGTRWCDIRTGYTPIGFGQLWHSTDDQWKGSRVRRYPVVHNTACRTDVQFGHLWDRRHHVLIPEIISVHLESEPAPLGANWRGRTTKRFGPPESKLPPQGTTDGNASFG